MIFIESFRALFQRPWTLWVGLRYLSSKKSTRFLSFITVMSFIGVALGVTAMLVVLSVMDGFETTLKERLMSTDIHILMEPKNTAPTFLDGLITSESTQNIVRKISSHSQIETTWKVLEAEAMLQIPSAVKGIVLKGVEDGRFKEFQGKIIERADPNSLLTRNKKGEFVSLPKVMIGESLSLQLGLNAGSEITLVSPVLTEGALESVPRMKRFIVEAVYRVGVPEHEIQYIYTTLPNVENFIRKRDRVSFLELRAKNFEEAIVLAADLKKEFTHFYVKDWVEMNSSLFASLRLERFAMFVILAFIVIVASFNIVTTLALMIMEKRKEISIMKAMGARDSQLGAVFLAEGLLIGFLGVLLGVCSSLVLSLALRKLDLLELPDIYYDRTIPVSFNVSYYIGIPTVAFLVVLAACLYPTLKASRLSVLEGLRNS